MRNGLAALLTALVILAAGVWVVRTGDVRLLVQKPDVLLITVDTLRADHLGAYGYPRATSPNLDRLAAAGVRFDRAIAAASRTAPSHASIMTSLFTREHSIGHVNGATMLVDETTLASLFRRAGFSTAAFIGNAVIRARTGLDIGFEVYDDDLPQPEKNRPLYFERIAEATTRRVLEWLARAGDRPVFLWVHYQDPHGPYTPPERYRGLLPVTAPEDEPELRQLKGNTGFRGIPSYQFVNGLTRLSQYQTRYAGEIFYADESIGQLLQALDERAEQRSSVVLFTSDHGESFGENDRYLSHGRSTTPQEARVPFILRAPGIVPGARSDVVHHVDIMPTLLALADLPAPEEVSGIALGPYLQSGEPLPDRLVYCDIGASLSAYWDDHFMRVVGVKDAWRRGDRSTREEMMPIWETYRWKAEGTWTSTEIARDQMGEIRSYFRDAVQMVEAPRLEDLDIERLRALGYVSPE